MDIESLNTFLTLASTRNFTRTANQLFVAQSTVTNRINELERELKLKLFHRTNKTVELTPDGERFRLYAEQVIELTQTSLAEITNARRFDNHLRIGSTDSIYEGHLAPLIMEYRQSHPTDSLKISIGLSNHLIDQLQSDLLDVVFTYLPLNKVSYSCEIFRQDALTLVTDINNKKHPDGILQQELINEPYLMCNFALQDVGQYIRKLFPRFHQFELEIDDCMKIVPYLIGRENYTFLPQDMADTYIREGKLREVRLLDFRTPVINSYIIFRKNKAKLLRNLIR
ncbi:MAG: LysR family transcriptional regulator [Lachnospiraceae bacterium]|nr:LysR family transcriptional regulator [Lachnospiraceae bacterium]